MGRSSTVSRHAAGCNPNYGGAFSVMEQVERVMRVVLLRWVQSIEELLPFTLDMRAVLCHLLTRGLSRIYADRAILY